MSALAADSVASMLILRYLINGLLATGVHFAVLSFGLNVVGIPSAGVANLIAAVFGISASFIGSRYFVFRAAHARLLPQVLSFGLLYAMLAMMHGVILYVWTDRAGLDYRFGFLIATGFQVAASYLGNKTMVFKA